MRGLLAALILIGALMATPVAHAQQPQQYWYYCDELHAYYPNVPTCPKAWRPVPAKPQSGAPQVSSPTVTQPPSTPLVPNNSAAEAQRKAQAEAAKRKAEQAEAEAKERQRQEAARQAIEERKRQDTAAGYKRVTVPDVIVDYKEMSEDDHLILTGYFSSVGQVGMFMDNPYGSHVIGMDDEEMSHDTRKRLLDCTNCQVTVWAHPGCTITSWGREGPMPCLIMERIKNGGYDGPGEILR